MISWEITDFVGPVPSPGELFNRLLVAEIQRYGKWVQRQTGKSRLRRSTVIPSGIRLSAKGAIHTSLGRRPKFTATRKLKGLKARPIKLLIIKRVAGVAGF
jgi:hypothetical protein